MSHQPLGPARQNALHHRLGFREAPKTDQGFGIADQVEIRQARGQPETPANVSQRFLMFAQADQHRGGDLLSVREVGVDRHRADRFRAACLAAGMSMRRPYYLALVAETLMSAGRSEEAKATLDQSPKVGFANRAAAIARRVSFSCRRFTFRSTARAIRSISDSAWTSRFAAPCPSDGTGCRLRGCVPSGRSVDRPSLDRIFGAAICPSIPVLALPRLGSAPEELPAIERQRVPIAPHELLAGPL